MTEIRARRSALRSLALAAALVLVAGCADVPPWAKSPTWVESPAWAGLGSWLRDAPDPFAFVPARNQIPGALVTSERVRLTGMLNRTPTMIYAEGAAEELIVNGIPKGRQARVKAPAKVAVVVRAPRGYDETAVGRVRVNGSEAEFRVTTIRRPPPGDLAALGTTVAAPGRLAQSVVVAPTGFRPGAMLTTAGPLTVQVETRDGRAAAPVALAPGAPFRLVARVPQGWSGPLDVEVRLGELRGTWQIRPPEPERLAAAED